MRGARVITLQFPTMYKQDKSVQQFETCQRRMPAFHFWCLQQNVLLWGQ